MAATDTRPCFQPITEGVWAWLESDDTMTRCIDLLSEMGADMEAQHLADWCEDAMREEAGDGLNPFILGAARLADYDDLLARVVAEWEARAEDTDEAE